MILDRLDRYRDAGLLLLRVGIGTSFLFHGWPKLVGGPEQWQGLAEAVGIGFLPVFFGFMAALSEFGGGLLLIAGLLFRPASLLLFFTMIGALVSHLSKGDGFTTYSHALELGVLFLALLFIGPGRYSLDARYGTAGRLRR